MAVFLISFLLLWGGLVSPAAAGLELSTDNRSLFFGRLQLGETKELIRAGSFHNEITCSSTGGKIWRLKIHLLHPLASGKQTIPLEQFQWQVVGTDGEGTIVNQHRYAPFRTAPQLVYISGPGETAGQQVKVQLKYQLVIPENQVSGIYQTIVRFTLTEVL